MIMTNLTAVVGRLEAAEKKLLVLEDQINDARQMVAFERIYLEAVMREIEEQLAPDDLEPQETDNIIPTAEFRTIVRNALSEYEIQDIVTSGVSVDRERESKHSMTFNAEIDEDISRQVVENAAENLQDYLTDRGYILTRKDFSDAN